MLFHALLGLQTCAQANEELRAQPTTFPNLVFDPFRNVCGQGCAPEGQTVVVISPVSNLAVISTYDRDSRDRNRNPSGESSVERLGDSDLKCPLRDHMLSAHQSLGGL